jgi:hypothetical protein
MLDCAFYIVSDSGHFIGVVALLNSLRLCGHHEPVFVVDAGLRPRQRALLEGHATIITPQEPLPPMLMKPAGPLACPAEVAVVLDADVIVTRPLTPLIDIARAGRLVAFENDDRNRDRFHADWGNLLDLGPLERRPYLADGQLLLPHPIARWLLPLWAEKQQLIDLRQSLLGVGRESDPFYFPDMDVFNAVVSASLPRNDLMTFPNRLAPHPPFDGVSLVNRASLHCAYADGARPFLLHHVQRKPWLAATPRNVYAALLPRLLLADDVCLRLEAAEVPLRLREGALARVDLMRASTQALLRSRLRGRLGIRPLLTQWRTALRGS